MCGTTQGGSDLMDVADFENNTYLPLNNIQNINTGDGKSFEIIMYPVP
jgi:hypothetical protein